MECSALQTNAKKRDAALEEARAAVEELVLAGGHAAELAPRSPDVMQAQASSPASFCGNVKFLVQERNTQDCTITLLPAVCPCRLTLRNANCDD